MSSFILRTNDNWDGLVKRASIQKEAQPAPAIPEAPEMVEGMPTAPGKKPMPDEPKPEIAAEPSTYLQKERKEVEHAKSIIMQIWGLLTEEAAEGGFDEVEVLLKAIKSLEDFVSVEESGSKPGKKKSAAKRKIDPVDSAIEQAFYRLGRGTQFNIMDIPKLFAQCRQEIAAGKEVDVAVQEAIEKFKLNLFGRAQRASLNVAQSTASLSPRSAWLGETPKTAGRIKDFMISIYDELAIQQEQLIGRPLTPEEDMKVWEETAQIANKRMKDLVGKEPKVEPEVGPEKEAAAKKPEAKPKREFPGMTEQQAREVWHGRGFTPKWLTKTRSQEMADKMKMSSMDPKELFGKFEEEITAKMEERLGRALSVEEKGKVSKQAEAAVADYFGGLMDQGKEAAKKQKLCANCEEPISDQVAKDNKGYCQECAFECWGEQGPK